jgi:hypothetical protein
MSKAGRNFVCVCCKETYPEEDAAHEPQFDGPVCGECRSRCIKAAAYLKHAGIARPMIKTDLNPNNYKRFI